MKKLALIFLLALHCTTLKQAPEIFELSEIQQPHQIFSDRERLLLVTMALLCTSEVAVFSQESRFPSITFENQEYPLYPKELAQRPELPSPWVTDDGIEVLIAHIKSGDFALIPVTVENGSPLVYSYRIDDLFGKDQQLHVDEGDFPTLARTGLHSESELDAKEMITGFPVSLINYIAHPGRFSYDGFIAADEDIITVLKYDNRRVRDLGLTHPQMARPLFHVWNVILKEIELGNWRRSWDIIWSSF